MSPSLELALDCGAGLGTEGVRVATRRACAGDRANCVSSPAEPQTPRLLRPPHREPFCGRESGILTALVLICDTAVLKRVTKTDWFSCNGSRQSRALRCLAFLPVRLRRSPSRAVRNRLASMRLGSRRRLHRLSRYRGTGFRSKSDQRRRHEM